MQTSRIARLLLAGEVKKASRLIGAAQSSATGEIEERLDVLEAIAERMRTTQPVPMSLLFHLAS